jgi:hypothetical protein
MGIDDYVHNKVQAAYDYAWDRWGLYVGHARAVFGGVFFAMPVAVIPFREHPTVLTYLMALVNFYLIYIIVFKNHLGQEVPLQRRGSLTKLNLRALSYRIMMGRWKILALLFMVLDFYLSSPLEWVLDTVSMFGWLYLNEVQVRERDSGRFEQRSFSFSGA